MVAGCWPAPGIAGLTHFLELYAVGAPIKSPPVNVGNRSRKLNLKGSISPQKLATLLHSARRPPEQMKHRSDIYTKTKAQSSDIVARETPY